MGRLIDADALLKKFNDTGIQITFDLPVEEILGEDVDMDDFAMLVQDAIQTYKKLVIQAIKEQPTAYDVEKIVAELKKNKGRACYGIECVKCVYNKDCYEGEMSEEVAIDNAIDIVRKGGVG